ncbi:MAG: hypothetical protein GY780_14380 [bacterium]|nr:hypothetical protein [bacterium]
MKNLKLTLLPTVLFAMLSIASVAQAGLPSNVFDLAETTRGPNGGTIEVFPNHVFNVQATDQTMETGVRISWTGAEDLEVFFNVFRDDLLLTELSSQDSVFVDTTALPLYTYDYSVQMLGLDGSNLYHIGQDDGSRGFFRPQQSSGSMYTDTGGVELTWQDRSSIEDGFIIFRDGAPIDSVSVNTTYYYDETSTPLQVHDYCISAYTTDGTSNYVISSSNQVSNAHSMVSQQHMVYVADGLGGLLHYDFTDPTNPVYNGSYVSGSSITSYANSLMIEGGMLRHLWVDDDPANIQIHNSVDTEGEPYEVIAPTWDTHLVADGSAGLALFYDVEGMMEVDRVYTLGTAVGVTYHSLQPDQGYAFVSALGVGLVVVQVDWDEMSMVSTITEATLGGSAVTAAMDGDNLFVAVDGFGIKVFDISNVGSPVEIGSLSDPSITAAFDLSLGATSAFITSDS